MFGIDLDSEFWYRHFIGFFTGDGNMQYNRKANSYMVSICINGIDKYYLDFLAQKFNSFKIYMHTNPLNNKKMYVLHLTSMVMYDILLEKGLCPRKSYVDLMDNGYKFYAGEDVIAQLLGLFDADGWIMKKGVAGLVQGIANKNLILEIQYILFSRFNIDSKVKIRKSGTCLDILVTGVNFKKLMYLFYKDYGKNEFICLDRKYITASYALLHHNFKTVFCKEEIINTFKSYLNIKPLLFDNYPHSYNIVIQDFCQYYNKINNKTYKAKSLIDYMVHNDLYKIVTFRDIYSVDVILKDLKKVCIKLNKCILERGDINLTELAEKYNIRNRFHLTNILIQEGLYVRKKNNKKR